MSRRGRSGPAISLFSFQDIITSVTAILIVVTLLLALDLVQRDPERAAESPNTISENLVARLAAVESELSQLRSALESEDSLIRDVASMSPGELSRENAQRQAAIRQLHAHKAQLKEASSKLDEKRKQALAEQFDLEPVREQTRRIEQEIAAIKQQATSENAEGRLIYSLPRGFQKQGWLAVVAERQISVAPLGRAARPIVFNAPAVSLFSGGVAAKFMDWIETEQLHGDYFLLLIRPDGPEVFDAVQEQFTRKQIAHGFDVIGANRAVLHPERGASP